MEYPETNVFAAPLGDNVDLDPDNKAYPFIYAFLNSDEDTANDGFGSLGVTVPVGRTIRHPISLDPDYNFRLLWAKYSVYHELASPAGQQIWYENIAGWGLEFWDYQTDIGTPLTRFIDLTLTVNNDAEQLYGGFNTEASVNLGGALLPIRMKAIQGYDYGMGQLRTPYLIPKDSSVTVEMTNTHPDKELVVNGMLYGVKIRM